MSEYIKSIAFVISEVSKIIHEASKIPAWRLIFIAITLLLAITLWHLPAIIDAFLQVWEG